MPQRKGILVTAKARDLQRKVAEALGPVETEAYDGDSKITLAEILDRRARVLRRRAVAGLSLDLAEALRFDRDA